MSKLASALLNVQKSDMTIRKDGMNPAFRSRYASLGSVLDEVVPVLNTNGLVLLQFPTELDGQPALRTKLLHAESGEFEEDTMLLVLGKNDPQGQGSGLTYARRYAALAILGLVADEDDDGNAATRSAREPQVNAGVLAPQPTPPVSQTVRNESASRAEFPIPEGVQAELAENGVPPDSGLPQDVVVHFGKNAGKKLAELSKNSVKWYAENELRPDATPADRRLKGAAQTLLGLA